MRFPAIAALVAAFLTAPHAADALRFAEDTIVFLDGNVAHFGNLDAEASTFDVTVSGTAVVAYTSPDTYFHNWFVNLEIGPYLTPEIGLLDSILLDAIGGPPETDVSIHHSGNSSGLSVTFPFPDHPPAEEYALDWSVSYRITAQQLDGLSGYLTYVSGDLETWAGEEPCDICNSEYENWDYGTISIIPEPDTALLVAVGLIGLAARQKRD